MDDSEREGLLQYIRELEKNARRWRTIATVALGVLVVFLLAAVVGGGTMSVFMRTRARQAERIARDQALVAEKEAQAALARAERLAAEQQKHAEATKKSKGKD
jgi:hypothetical protein